MSRPSYFPKAVPALLAALVLNGAAYAADGAFAVDDAGVEDPGACKVEAFASFARNDDRVLTVAPACGLRLGVPFSVGLQVDRARSAGEWSTGLGLKAKTALVPLGDGPLGVALSGGVSYDVTTRQTTEWFVNLPLTLRLSEPLSINLNAGMLWDRGEGREYFTWGAGFVLALSEPVKLIGEVFGQGSDDPGAQIGLRYTPHEKIDFDLIYGRNLAGEKSDWVTLGVNLRF